MSDVGAMVAQLMAAGCAPDVAAQVVAEAFVAGTLAAAVRVTSADESVTSADESVTRRRESDRIRQQNRRDNLRISAESRDNPQTSNSASISKDIKKESKRGTRIPSDW